MEKIEETFSVKRIVQLTIGLIGLISAILGIYAFFFQDKSIQLEYEILANTNVLDINANITKLDIIYAGSSLKSSNENLRIINVRVRNTGSESILKSFYDDNDPLGITVSNGRIIEKPELVNTSSKYISKNLRISLDSANHIIFSDIILEPNESYTIKLLVLHPINKAPEVHAAGKIAGIQKIPVLSLAQQAKAQKSFWAATFDGNIYSQVARAFSYTLVVIIVIIIIGTSASKISEYSDQRKRIKLINEFKKNDNYQYNRMDDAIFNRYNNDGASIFPEYQKLLKDNEFLNKKYNNYLSNQKGKTQSDKKSEMKDMRESFIDNQLFIQRNEWHAIRELISDGYAIKDKDILVINQPMKSTLDDFISFLKQKRKYRDVRISLNGINPEMN
jgi:hypothetical protein